MKDLKEKEEEYLKLSFYKICKSWIEKDHENSSVDWVKLMTDDLFRRYGDSIIAQSLQKESSPSNYHEVYNMVSELRKVFKSKTEDAYYSGYLDALQKESKTDLKMCTGCGKFSDEKIKPTALACCPDSNYIKATGELIKKDYVWKYSLPKSKTDLGEVEKFMDSKEIEIEEYISKNGYKMHSLSTDGECLTTQGIIEMCVKYISEYYKLQTKEEKEKANCKYVKREGESCTLNDNCKYPNCEEKESGEVEYCKEELFDKVANRLMHKWDLKEFKQSHKRLYDVIMESMEEYKSISPQTVAEKGRDENNKFEHIEKGLS